jgi:hypothetical protein
VEQKYFYLQYGRCFKSGKLTLVLVEVDDNTDPCLFGIKRDFGKLPFFVPSSTTNAFPDLINYDSN